MSVNKVQLSNGETIIDISDSTVTPETLAEGVTAHDASGKKITGKMIPGGGTSVQTDWNQTDETAPDFLKNKPFNGKPTWDDIGSSVTVFVDAQNTEFPDGMAVFVIEALPTTGDVLTVEFDGETHQCFVYDFLEGTNYIGDVGLVTGELTPGAVPYCVMFAEDSCVVVVADATQPHSIKVSGRARTKIPNIYIPELFTKIYIAQNNDGYLAADALGSELLTYEEFMQKVSASVVILSFGDSRYYYPTEVNLHAGENYGAIKCMEGTGELKTYYTAEYTPET